jgi:hypothetical protein
LQPYPRFKSEWVYVDGKPSKLRASFSGNTVEYRLHLALHPNRQLLQLGKLNDRAIVVSPHIPDALAQDLRQCGVAHADLNGRLFLLGKMHLVDIRAGKSLYRSEQKGPDPFSPKASRIVRAFLCQRGQLLTQDDLVESTKVSRALVSKVLTQLIDEDFIEQVNKATKTQSAHYELKQFNRLLDNWADKDDWQKRVTVHQFSLLDNDLDDLAHKLVNAVGADEIAFTQWIAAWQLRPHTTTPVISAYLKNQQLLDEISGRPVDSGGNLWIIIPQDEGVFQYSRLVKGLPLVSDVQVYLDLIDAGLRGPEAASELRKWEGFTR